MIKGKQWLATGAFMLSVACLGSPAVQAADYGTITVDGYAQDTYVANQAVVIATNRVEKDNLATAKADNDRSSARFLQALQALGIPSNQIKTNDYTVAENQQYMPATKTYKTVYTVTNSIQVTINDKVNTSKVIDAATNAGISNVRLDQIGLNDADKRAMKDKLLIEAAKDARQKADALAAALGTKVVGVDSLNEDQYYAQPRVAMYKMDSLAAAAPTTSQIEYGNQKSDEHVTVVFRVK